MTIHWSTVHRQTLRGWRTQDEHDDVADTAPSAAQAWNYLRALPIPKVEGTAAKDVAPVVASLQEPTPPAKLELRQELLRWSLLFHLRSGGDGASWDDHRTARMLVALWHEVGGFRFAVEVITSPPLFSAVASWAPSAMAARRLDASSTLEIDHVTEPGLVLHTEVWPLWFALRMRVAVMSDAQLAAAVAAAHSLVPAKPPDTITEEVTDPWYVWALLVFTLSRVPDFTGPEIERMLDAIGERQLPYPDMLAAAAPDVASARRVLERVFANDTRIPMSHLLDLVESFGGEAADLIAEIYEHQRAGVAKTYLKKIDAALAFARKLASGRPLPGSKKTTAANKSAAKSVARKKPAMKKPAMKKPAMKKPAGKMVGKKATGKKR